MQYLKSNKGERIISNLIIFRVLIFDISNIEYYLIFVNCFLVLNKCILFAAIQTFNFLHLVIFASYK